MKLVVVARSALIFTLTPLVIAAPARAQFDINLNSQLLNQRQLLSPINNQRLRSLNLARPPMRAPERTEVGAGRGVEIATTYRRDPAVSIRVRRQFVDFVRKVGGPNEATRVEADFAKFDPVQIWSQIVRENGLRAGDTTDALTAYLSLNWAMANGKDVDLPQSRALRDELHRMMNSNPQFLRMSEAERQDFSETLMCNFIYQQGAYSHAIRSGDRRFASQLGDAAEARFKNEMGLSLRSVRLTSRGISGDG